MGNAHVSRLLGRSRKHTASGAAPPPHLQAAEEVADAVLREGFPYVPPALKVRLSADRALRSATARPSTARPTC